MYGHQFYKYPIIKRVEFLNSELIIGRFESLEALTEDIFVDIEELKEELRRGGYFFVPELNQFLRIEKGRAG